MELPIRQEALRAAVLAVADEVIDGGDLPAERILDEWKKLLLLGTTPSRGLQVLVETGWITAFPELDALRGCPQDPTWHPEGDVFVHTGHVLDRFAAERIGDEIEDLTVGFAALCHDFGKPATTQFTDGRWRSPAHDVAGVEPTRAFLDRMGVPRAIRDQALLLVRHHLAPAQLHQGGAGSSAVRRLANRVHRIDQLVRVARADHGGRPPKPWDDFPSGQWLLDAADSLGVTDAGPTPILQGRHLIADLGLEPGPAFGPLLDAVFQAQLEGTVTTLDEGLALAQTLVAPEAR